MSVESFLLSVNHGIRVTKVLSKSSTSCITTKSSDPFCLVCETEPSKYCCPKCSTPYCSLKCYQNHNNSCTESFFQGLVSQELEFQRQDKDERSSNQGNILSILNRIQAQEIDNDNNVDDENTNYTDFPEQDLKHIYSALESNDEELLSKYFSPTIQTAFERDVQAGRLSQKDVREWIPWWRSILDSEREDEDQLNNSNMSTFTTTLDERLLAIPPLSKLRITSSSPSSSTSSPDWPSPNLGYNLISILWSIIETLEWYGGPEQACCLEAAETFHYICPVISKDARYETVSHLVMEQPRLSSPQKQTEKFTFYNDVIIILENPRHVAHLLLDGIDIIQQGAIDWFSASSAAKRSNNDKPLLDKKERLKWKKVNKKLEFYLSWARDRNKSYWTYLIHDMEVWKDNSLIIA